MKQWYDFWNFFALWMWKVWHFLQEKRSSFSVLNSQKNSWYFLVLWWLSFEITECSRYITILHADAFINTSLLLISYWSNKILDLQLTRAIYSTALTILLALCYIYAIIQCSLSVCQAYAILPIFMSIGNCSSISNYIFSEIL